MTKERSIDLKLLQLFDQHALAAYRIEDLQQQWAVPLQSTVDPHLNTLGKLRRHLSRNFIHRLANWPQRMFHRNTFL
jgi:hypothetical protein